MTSYLSLLALAAPLGFVAVAAMARPVGTAVSVERCGGRGGGTRCGSGRGRRGGHRPGGRSREPHLWVGGLGFSIRLDAVIVLMLGIGRRVVGMVVGCYPAGSAGGLGSGASAAGGAT